MGPRSHRAHRFGRGPQQAQRREAVVGDAAGGGQPPQRGERRALRETGALGELVEILRAARGECEKNAALVAVSEFRGRGVRRSRGYSPRRRARRRRVGAAGT